MDMEGDESKIDAVDLVGKAEADGKFAKLQSVLDDHGWDTSAGTLVMLAQKDERTRGKSPDEIADMVSEDPSLYDDLEAYQPGGKLDKPEPPPPPAEPDEDDVADMGGFLDKSASMKGKDPKKALKAAGGKKPDEMGLNDKIDFMKKTAGG